MNKIVLTNMKLLSACKRTGIDALLVRKYTTKYRTLKTTMYNAAFGSVP